MQEKNKQAILDETLEKLLHNRDAIVESSPYGKRVFRAFKTLLKNSHRETNEYEIGKIVVIVASPSNMTSCFIEGINKATRERIPNLGDLVHDTEDGFFGKVESKVEDNLNYVGIPDVEKAWEILYNNVLPKELNVEIIYEYTPPYVMYSWDLLQIDPNSRISAIIVYWQE